MLVLIPLVYIKKCLTKPYVKRWFMSFWFGLSFIVLFSQPGKNGALTVSSSTILNSYSPVTSNLVAGSTSVNVISQSVLIPLCPGDLIMIYQAQGANINTGNTSTYGAVTAYNNAGLYEFT